MKPFILLFGSLICCHFSDAQTLKTDSLKGNWRAVAFYDPDKMYYSSLTDSFALYEKKALGLSPDMMSDDAVREAAFRLMRILSKKQLETIFLMCDAKGNASLSFDGNTTPFLYSEKNQRAESGKKILDMQLTVQKGFLVITNPGGRSKSTIWLRKE